MLNKKDHEKSAKNKTSLRKAVDLKCKECIYDPFDAGTWRYQVLACTASNCPLYNFRPEPIGNHTDARQASNGF